MCSVLLKFAKSVSRTGPPFLYKHLQFPIRKLLQETAGTMDGAKGIKKMGYMFNTEGYLRKINQDGLPGDEPFQFNVSNLHHECQAHYEELGAAVTEYIYNVLETEHKMTRLPVPKSGKNGTFIFASKDYEKKDNLILLIHGSGAVRAGQWARSLIINENLYIGSQLTYVKKALAKDYAVMVLNPNENYIEEEKKIKHSGSPEEHARYVWDTYVTKARAANIGIVAHSYGGVTTVVLADELKKEFEKRVKAIAFTDSVHCYSNVDINDYMKKVAVNWIASTEPLDTAVNTPDYDIKRVSAGHHQHEKTSCSAVDSIFKFFEEKFSTK